MFDKALAAKHMKYRRLVTLSRKMEYMRENGIDPNEETLSALNADMIHTAREFEVMIVKMIEEAE